jgi:hypothetical protein
MGGGTIIPRSLMTKGNKKFFKLGQIKNKIIYDPLIFVTNSFSKN